MKKKYASILFLVFTLFCGGCSASKNNTTDALDPAGNTKQEMAKRDSVSQEWDSEVADDKAKDNSGEDYLDLIDNQRVAADDHSLLTFSLKVDTSAYHNVERYIESGNLPPVEAVKTEELINYFNYEKKMEFTADDPFAIYTEIGQSPYDASKYLAFIRVKSKELDRDQLPSSNLTFLIDTSGSMDSFDKLPLLKEAFSLLVDQLTEDDKVSIVTYAGSAEIVIDSISGADKKTILNAIDTLTSGGSTAGAEGITTAYQLAAKNYREGGNNRIILATDGDFNVGLSSLDELEDLVTKQRDNGIYFSILGFGTGNLKDDKMETLAKNGNGNYSYINSVSAANKILVEEMGSNLFVIADDVKAQIEFNPNNIKSYRLIGYENRIMDNQDFADDTKDAGEIGIGTDVVVLCELELQQDNETENLKYQTNKKEVSESGEFSDELFEVRIRYKNPGELESKLMLKPVNKQEIIDQTSTDFQFATAVSGFAHLLRNSEYKGTVTIQQLIEITEKNLGKEDYQYRYEFLNMIKAYQRMIK